MASVLNALQEQLAELALYKKMYGPLKEVPAEEEEEEEDGSDTALEY
jgi:hypothetical protein